MAKFKIGVLLFDQAELLDFAGPIQVFSALHYLYPDDCAPVVTIGMSETISISKLGMQLIPDRTIKDFDEELDLFLIPGGLGTRPLIKSPDMLGQIDQIIDRSKRLATVCTGSLVAAKLGRLKGLRATTHYLATDLLQELDASLIVDRSKRFYDHDHLIISEGVSAGIDMSFYLIEKLFGKEKSDSVRKYIEYFPDK